jgi:hypothetical protein
VRCAECACCLSRASGGRPEGCVLVVEHNRRVADLITGLALVAKAVSAAG